MQHLFRTAPLLALMVLAGCASSAGTADLGYRLPGPRDAAYAPAAEPTPAPSKQIAEAQSLTDVTGFVDPAALQLMSEKEKSEAASAQFNALQFGRTGAPRAWQGDRGASGEVVVGPPVNVNSLYCRDFTHTITAGSQNFVKKGTACREFDGHWSVVSTG